VKDVSIKPVTPLSEEETDSNEDNVKEPQTVPMSPACATMSDILNMCSELDEQAVALYNKELSSDAPSPNDRDIRGSSPRLTTIACRALRLRLYGASLLAANLTCPDMFGACPGVGSNFDPCSDKRVNAIVDSDVAKVERLRLVDDVATVYHRIEYLLDIAETRIWDAALCGWNNRSGQLLTALETYTNR